MAQVSRYFLFLIFLFSVRSSFSQAQPIIDNGFLSTQSWGGSIHPSGKFMVRADRTTIHAYDRLNKMLFQSYQSQCIANNLYFTADGSYLIVATLGEIDEECNRVLIYDFYTGEQVLNVKGSVIPSLTDNDNIYLIVPNTDSTAVYMGEYKLEKINLPQIRKGISPPKQFFPDAKKWDATTSVAQIVSPGSIQFLVDTLLIKDGQSGVEMYSINDAKVVATVESAMLFAFNYRKADNKMYFAPANRNDVYKIYDFNKKESIITGLTQGSADHVVFESDSIAYKVEVKSRIRWQLGVPYNCVVEKVNAFKPYYYYQKIVLLDTLEHDLFNNGMYYSQVLADSKLVLHNKTHLLDLNNFSSHAYHTMVDTNLIHPAFITIDPLTEDYIIVNDNKWNTSGNGQIHTIEAYATNCSDTLYAFGLKEVSRKKVLVNSILQNHSKVKMNLINYPCSQRLRKNQMDAYLPTIIDDNYMIANSPNKKLTVYENDGIYYLDGGYSLISIQKELISTNNDDRMKLSKKIINDDNNWSNLYNWNSQLPLQVFPYEIRSAVLNYPRAKTENIPLKIPFQLDNKRDENKFYYAPYLNPGKVVCRDVTEAKKAYVQSIFKQSMDGLGRLTISILNRPEVPDLSYSGIIPENDIYFYDLILPLWSNQRIALNYAHGEIKLMDEKGNVRTKSSFYRDGEFIHLTKDGYYFASKNKLNRMSIRLQDKVYPLEQFDLKYNRPDIVLKQLGSKDTLLITSYYKAYLKRLKKMGFTEDMLKEDFNLPLLKIKNREEIPFVTDSVGLWLEIEMKDMKYSLDRLCVYINEVPVYGTAGISLRKGNAQEMYKRIKLLLSEGLNKIEVSVLNQAGAESYKEVVKINYKPKQVVKPNLYLITIGDSKYKDNRYDLTYASKDAGDIKALFEKNESNLYENVYTTVLTNEMVTKENILKLKKTLLAAKREDVVVVSIAGHGVLDKDYNYYFATYDMDFDKPSERGIPYEEMESLVDSLTALKKIIFIDACHSGEIDKEEVQQLAITNTSSGDIKFRSAGAGIQKKNIGLKTSSELVSELFSDLRKGTGATIVASAGGAEFAMESAEWKNGLFTYCLLHGLQDKTADLNGDGFIMMSELQLYLRKEVSTLSKGAQQPSSRYQNMSNDFRIW